MIKQQQQNQRFGPQLRYSDVTVALVEQRRQCSARGEKHEAFGCHLCIRVITKLAKQQADAAEKTEG